MTSLQQRIEIHIPRKRKENVTDYQKVTFKYQKNLNYNKNKGINKFYETVMQAMLRSFDFKNLKVILIASSGFVGEGLIKYIFNEAIKVDNKELLQSRPKFLQLHCSSGHMHSLNEVLNSPSVSAKLIDTKFAQETMALNRFYKTLHNNETKAWYGIKEVFLAAERGAIETLLISDMLFRYIAYYIMNLKIDIGIEVMMSMKDDVM